MGNCISFKRERDAGGDFLTSTMQSAPAARKGARNHKHNKAKTTLETVDQAVDLRKSQSKRSRTVQRSTLENQSKTVQAAGRTGKLKPCQPRHGEDKKMTADMQSKPEAERRLSRQDHQQCAADIPGADDGTCEVDLYRGAEEIEQERQEKHQAYAASIVPNFEDQDSVGAPECLLSYSQREWRGNTYKSRLIKKGYEAIAQTFESLRRVRGDNYCALRATLFQILSQSQKLPAWLQDPEIIQWPKQMLSVQDLVDQWMFPLDSKNTGGAVEKLQCCLNLLKARWREAVQCPSLVERERVCQQVFVGQSEEYELLEALKFLMLRTAVTLHSEMDKALHVPEFCWLLFARDTSKCPRTFFTNHLRHVGFNGGLEQVEMFLLGYSLQQTIQVYRLYKTDTEEFITYYPDDHRKDWPCLSLVTEDDRHYNVPVPKQSSSKFDSSGRPKWNLPSGGQAQDKHGTHL